jgi:hypothetical protein
VTAAVARGHGSPPIDSRSPQPTCRHWAGAGPERLSSSTGRCWPIEGAAASALPQGGSG